MWRPRLILALSAQKSNNIRKIKKKKKLEADKFPLKFVTHFLFFSCLISKDQKIEMYK